VSSFAVCLCRELGNGAVSTHDVLTLGDRLEMCYVAACFEPTPLGFDVVEDEARWNRTIDVLVGDTMNTNAAIVDADLPVAVR
jgi:hypothetical protein